MHNQKKSIIFFCFFPLDITVWIRPKTLVLSRVHIYSFPFPMFLMVRGSVVMLMGLFVFGRARLDYQLLLMRILIPMFCPHLPKIALATVINLALAYEKKRQRLKIDYNLIDFSCWKLHNGALNFYMLDQKYEINLVVQFLRSLWSVIRVVWQQWDKTCLFKMMSIIYKWMSLFHRPCQKRVSRNLQTSDDMLLTLPSRNSLPNWTLESSWTIFIFDQYPDKNYPQSGGEAQFKWLGKTADRPSEKLFDKLKANFGLTGTINVAESPDCLLSQTKWQPISISYS